mgnify:CR=1 FL=1
MDISGVLLNALATRVSFTAQLPPGTTVELARSLLHVLYNATRHVTVAQQCLAHIDRLDRLFSLFAEEWMTAELADILILVLIK